MKYIITAALLFQSLVLAAQLPDFETNVDEAFIASHLAIKKYGGRYNHFISFTTHSRFIGQKSYFILFKENESWLLHKLTAKEKANGKIKFKRRDILNIDQQALIDFVSFLDTLKFWDIDQTLLNKSERNNGGGTTRVLEILDGVTFEVFAKSNQSYRLISAHSPESRQKFLFTQDRENFIKARDAFHDLIDINGN